MSDGFDHRRTEESGSRWTDGTGSRWPDEGNTPPENGDPTRPSPLRVLADSAVKAWDHLGLTLLVSFVTFCLLAAIALLVFGAPSSSPLLAIIRSAILLAITFAVMAGSVSCAKQVISGGDAGFHSFVDGWRRYGTGAFCLGLLNGAVAAVLASDLLFFTRHPRPSLRWMAALFAWPILLWIASFLYQLPLLVCREGFTPGKAFIQAHLLVLANPVFTGILASVMIVLWGVSALTWAPLAIATPFVSSLLGVYAVTAMVDRYEALEAMKGTKGSEPR